MKAANPLLGSFIGLGIIALVGLETAMMLAIGALLYLIMDKLTGGARKKQVQPEDDGVSERTKEFRRKVEEGKRAALNGRDPDVIVNLINADGKKSSIIVKSTGEIETTGAPDPDVLRAAMQLKESIHQFGVESVAAELQRQVNIINQEKKDGDS